MSEQESFIGKMSLKYSDSPTVKALVQLAPGGGSLDSLMNKRAEEIKHARLESFYDELAKGNLELTPEIIQSEDFLHSYFSTVSAVIRTKRREKIKILAQLLKASTSQTALKNTDEYEDLLSIVDEMSYRELQTLSLLDKYESYFPRQADENKLQRSSRYWPQLMEELKELLQLSKEEVEGVLTRLNRTGCYETFVGGFIGYSGGQGCLTATYLRVKALIQLGAEKV